MAKDLVWLENYSFAAWGCASCSWIISNVGLTLPGEASAAIKAAFQKDDCKKFPPRHVSLTDGRTKSRVSAQYGYSSQQLHRAS